MPESFDADPVLQGLTDFQRATVRHVMDRFFGERPTKRFLTADETGLGKSLVARGVIASIIERLQHDDAVERIDVLYVCSNSDIAEQNLARLNVTEEEHLPFATRLTLLALESHRLTGRKAAGLKPVNLVSFTPGTSFDKGHSRGKSEERALLFLLLRDILNLDSGDQRRAKVVLQHPVKIRQNFQWTIEQLERHERVRGSFDERIVAAFTEQIRSSDLGKRFATMVAGIGNRRTMNQGEIAQCGSLVSELRGALASASVDCLEPDLIILDEFQRFRHLLDIESGGPAAELAHDLFNHADARVLLLSATPYKPFTYAAEAAAGDDHHRDFLTTLRFLATNDEAEVDHIRERLAAFRDAAVAGGSADHLVADIRESLMRYMTRTERPQAATVDMLEECPLPAEELDPADFVDFAALKRVARYLEVPFLLEYWKSAPYFVNFSEGYKLGEEMREVLKSKSDAEEMRGLLASTRHLDRHAVENDLEVEPGNARLRALVRETADKGWWRLLWMPPSLPYFTPSGPYAELGESITKKLVFSSWAATPTAIAALVSHAAQRHTADPPGTASGARRGRLDFRMDGSRPGAMSTLALFWPNPTLARNADPLDLAAAAEGVLDADTAAAQLQEDLVARLPRPTLSSAPEAWHWTAAFRLSGAVPDAVIADPHHATLALAGILPEVARRDEPEGDRPDPIGLRAHIDLAARARSQELGDPSPDALLSLVELALHGPGNVAWRAIGRHLGGSEVSEKTHWSAAATVASGFRSLFNRPDVAGLLDALHPDTVYWRTVLTYCAGGNLQAVMDEYLHHLIGNLGPAPLTDTTLMSIAGKVRDAIAMRPAPYTAFDPWDPDKPIAFQSRFAMRFGNRRQTEGDARQPAIRNAFNSPFWPFVLATTSVGQEGIDLHWWCHSVMHWNTPASPVDFDQREGRIHRYGGHAIRKNVADRHRAEMLAAAPGDPWTAGYAVSLEHRAKMGELSPHWVYPGAAKVQRVISPFPLSSDHDRLRRLKDDVVLYRLAFGQPRQEDFVDLLKRRGLQADPTSAGRLYVNLAPRPEPSP